jgi:hypothetical protein
MLLTHPLKNGGKYPNGEIRVSICIILSAFSHIDQHGENTGPLVFQDPKPFHAIGKHFQPYPVSFTSTWRQGRTTIVSITIIRWKFKNGPHKPKGHTVGISVFRKSLCTDPFIRPGSHSGQMKHTQKPSQGQYKGRGYCRLMKSFNCGSLPALNDKKQ